MERKYEKLVKNFTIGDLNFDVAINRAIARDICEEYPEYIAGILELQKKDLIGKDTYTNEESIKMQIIKDKMDEVAEKMVISALPKMLKFRYEGMPNPKFFDNNWEQTAFAIYNFLDENNLLADYYDEETDEYINGMITILAGFIVEGFLQGEGTPAKKPKIKIISK